MPTVANVQIGVSGGAAGKAERDAVIAFYCGLLDMKAYEPFDNGYIKLTRGDGLLPELALEAIAARAMLGHSGPTLITLSRSTSTWRWPISTAPSRP